MEKVTWWAIWRRRVWSGDRERRNQSGPYPTGEASDIPLSNPPSSSPPYSLPWPFFFTQNLPRSAPTTPAHTKKSLLFQTQNSYPPKNRRILWPKLIKVVEVFFSSSFGSIFCIVPQKKKNSKFSPGESLKQSLKTRTDGKLCRSNPETEREREGWPEFLKGSSQTRRRMIEEEEWERDTKQSRVFLGERVKETKEGSE